MSATAELASLRERTALRARASLSFYALAVLGHKGIREPRLRELQNGSTPRSRSEESVLESWLRFKAGEATSPLRLEGAPA